MILKVFAVHDTKAAAFLQPFYSPSLGSAIRAFSDAVQDKSCPFNKHPEDYILYEVGSYDDKNALLSALTPIKLTATAAEFIVTEPAFAKIMNPDKKIDTKEVERVEQLNGKKSS